MIQIGFNEIGLHKPDVDETLYDHIYATRRITSCYTRHNNMFCTIKNPKFPKKSKSSKNKKIFEKADRVALAAGQEPQLSERIFQKITYFHNLQHRYSLGNSML